MSGLQKALDAITDDIRMSHHKYGSRMMPPGVAKSPWAKREGWFYDDPRIPGYHGLGETTTQQTVDTGVNAALVAENERLKAEIEALKNLQNEALPEVAEPVQEIEEVAESGETVAEEGETPAPRRRGRQSRQG